MCLSRSYLTLVTRLVAASAIVLLLATLSGEAVLGMWRPFWSMEQARLDKKGDKAITGLKSSIEQTDLDRVFLLKESIRWLTPPRDAQRIQITMPEYTLLSGLIRLLRYEFGIFYSGQKSIEQEEFVQTFNDKIYKPCQQFHSKLGDWWKKSSKGQYAKNDRFAWLVAENICRIILESRSDEFVQGLFKKFYQSADPALEHHWPARSPKIAAKVDLVMQTVKPIDIARLRLLADCIRWSRVLGTVRSLSSGPELIEKPVQPIDEKKLVDGLATFSRIESGYSEEASDRASIEQLIRKELFEPCESIHSQFHRITKKEAPSWASLERICLTFAYISESGDPSKLLEQVYNEYKEKLEAVRSDSTLKARDAEDMMRLIHAPELD